MSSRGMRTAVAAGAVGLAFGLAACGPTTTTQGSASQAPATPAAVPSTATPPSASPSTAKSSAKPGGTPSAHSSQTGAGTVTDPGGACQPVKLPADTQMVNITSVQDPTTLYAKATKPSCSAPSGQWMWQSTGAADAYPIANGATFKLTMGYFDAKPVTEDQFMAHVKKCEAGQQDSFAACNRPPGQGTYKITLDDFGAITSATEVFYS